ncbi:MAG: ATP-binding protein [Armatimonadetes bacterium]|nr:ATP-binding protein [Armatimonadota bacterium]
MATTALELVVPADPAYLELVGQVVTFVAMRMGFADRDAARIRLAVDEACANVVSHATPDGAPYRVVCEEQGERLVVRVQDAGPVFDLEAFANPNLDVPLEKRQVGGLGLYLMRRVMDSVELMARDDGKELVLSKVLPRPEETADGD